MDQHFLQLLVPLSNADKHRVVQPGFFGLDEPPEGFLARNEDVGDMLEGTFAQGGPLSLDTNVVDCRFEIAGPNPHVQMQGNLTLLVGFGEKGFAWNAIVDMARSVGQVIDAFPQFFNAQEA
jgi:hypothetical protein